MPLVLSTLSALGSLLGIVAVLLALVILALRWLFPLPPVPEAEPLTAIPISPLTRLGARVGALAEQHPGQSGVIALPGGRDALAARVLLARAAEASIDVQYYIWQRDTTGLLLLDELRRAAQRGVRVRLLLDDNGIPGLDAELAALDSLPNVEVRLYNPFTLRRPKLLCYLFDFPRLNRRMHNKSMTVDGAVTVVGGRNIGDTYFAYGDGTHFFDLDVLAAGPAAAEVAANFDRYWRSAPVRPAADLLPAATAGLDLLREASEARRRSDKGGDYMARIRSSTLLDEVLSDARRLEWTQVTMISDDPRKTLADLKDHRLLVGQLPAAMGEPTRSYHLASAYFIPGRRGRRLLTRLAQAGVDVRVLTNSLGSTDVPAVHSAYQKYRRRLLRAGIHLFELRARPGKLKGRLARHFLSGSASSLHAKTFTVDGRRIFIGSFNFDPRSARLNTEMGFVIDSPAMADTLGRLIAQPAASYAVTLTNRGTLQWTERGPDGHRDPWHRDPHTRWPKRAWVTVLSWLPLEWLL